MKSAADINSVLSVPDINGFKIEVNNSTIYTKPEKGNAPCHSHDFCEIFINISGNISFCVEDNVYTLTRGDVLFIKPNVLHFAVYNKKCSTENCFIFFPVKNNEKLFEQLTYNSSKTGCLVNIPQDKREEVISVCINLAKSKTDDYITILSQFLRILEIIKNSPHSKDTHKCYHREQIDEIVSYINRNFTVDFTINELSRNFNISVKTLERYFKTYIHTTPREYIKILRLTHASKLLRMQNSVSFACFESGFHDISYFISSFKEYFGETPLKYKNNFIRNE